MRRYIACLLTLGVSCTFAQQLPGQIQMPTQNGQHSQVSHVTPEADASSPMLRKIGVPHAQVRSVATALSLRYDKDDSVRIAPDAKNQQIVVMAPEAAQQQIAMDVQKFLQAAQVRKSALGAMGPLEVQLNNINWRTFEQALQQAHGGNTPVTTSRSSDTATYQLTNAPLQGTVVRVNRTQNQVVIDGADTARAGWQQMISGLDAAPSRAGSRTEVMRMDHVEPAPIQRAMRLLRELRPAGQPSGQPASAKQPIFRTAAFQQPQGDAGTPPPAEGDENLGVIGDAEIQFIPDLGQMLIKGTPQEIARIKEIINEIKDANELTKPEIKVLQLEHADCNAVATLLQQLYDDVLSARQGSVNITSLDSPNALLLIGRAEAIQSLEELIAKIDLPVSESSRLRVFRLRNASAADAEVVVRDFFAEGEDDGARPGLGLRVRILADYRTNSLIINASPRDMSEVQRLINDLDVESTEATNEIKIFSLNNAAAEDLATTLDAAISGSDATGNDNITNASTGLSVVAVDGDQNRIVSSGILAGASITADSGANALVVRAPSTSMPLIAELIRQLDKAPGIDSLVKVFTIQNGDAAQLTAALTELFGDDAATSGTTIGAANVAGLPLTTASAESTLIPLRFSTDIRTNSIIASGSGADLEVVESLLLRLDSEGFAERITEVIWLRYADATAIATAITNYVNERSQSQNNIQQYNQGLGPYDLIDRDLIVVPEDQSNSLLLSVSPRLYEDVRRLIDRLDRRRPMVLIKVLMAEVALEDTFEVGGELGLQDSLVFDRGLAVADVPGTTATGIPGFNFNNNGVPNVNTVARNTLAASGVTTFGLGTTSAATGYGGFVLNAASESVSLLIRTLHEANRLQVLSRPQVMTVDGTESLVSVGSRVARITGVVINNNNSQTVTEDIDVGLILRVTPRVGADGLITMAIDATRSARDPNNGTPIVDGNGNVVVINDILQTTAQSTLSAYSGQTVIFGGLIQKSRTNISRRVPLIADIPLLGNLFKFDTESESRNELLLVMTPVLVDDTNDLEYIKESESSRMSWCLADVVEAHGDVGLHGGYGLWGPAVGNTIYPDMQPTVQNETVISDEPIGTPHSQAPVQSSQPTYQQPTYQQPAYQQPSQPTIGQPLTSQPAATPSTPAMNAPPVPNGEGFAAPISDSLPPPVSEALPAPAAALDAVHVQPLDGQILPQSFESGMSAPAAVKKPVVNPLQSGSGHASVGVPTMGIAASRASSTGRAETDMQVAGAVQKSNQGQTVPVGWWNAQNDKSRTQTASSFAMKPKPKRLGQSSSTAQLPAANQNTFKTDTAPASQGGSLLLPAISPRSWIR